MRYILMNKDEPWALFSCIQDEFGEESAVLNEWYTDLRPLGLQSLTAWLEKRKAPKHRKHIEQLLEQYGCVDLEGFLRVTHALSLNDTFWVKEESETLGWDEVSLYRNEFDALIAQAAFSGVISVESLSSTSPEFGTDGYYAKCWVREPDGIYLYKGGSDTYEIEPLSEFLACQLAAQICPQAVDYDLDFYHHRLISKCRLFTDEQAGLIKISDFPNRPTTVSELLRLYAGFGAEDALRRMFVLDALILNTDRHLGNFGFLFDNQTMEIQKPAPVFDHNRSLLFDLDEDQLANPDWYIGKCRPRIGVDFIKTARGMLTDEIRQELKNLDGFRFMLHSDIELPEERLNRLSEIVEQQRRAILA